MPVAVGNALFGAYNMRAEDAFTWVGNEFTFSELSRMPCDQGMKYRTEIMFSTVQQHSDGPVVAGIYPGKIAELEWP
jgi:hypothetical protein